MQAIVLQTIVAKDELCTQLCGATRARHSVGTGDDETRECLSHEHSLIADLARVAVGRHRDRHRRRLTTIATTDDGRTHLVTRALVCQPGHEWRLAGTTHGEIA